MSPTPGLLAARRGRTAITPFSPSDISGLHVWLKADSLALSDNDSVGTWADQSGNGRDVTQGTAANKPTYKTNIVNSKPVVRFDGSNDFLAWAAGSTLNGPTAASIFCVLNVALDPPADGNKSGIWALSNHANAAHHPWTDGKILDGTGNNASRYDTGNPATNLAAWHLYEIVMDSSAWTSYLNGTQHFTSSSGITISFNFGASPRLGAWFSTYFLNGDIAEFIFYNSALSTANRQAVESYLTAKYAL